MTISMLVDNDVVIKLARMDTFEDGLKVISASPGAVGSLRVMLRYMGRADESRRLSLTRGNQAEADRLNTALHSIVETELTPAESADAAVVMKIVLESGLDLDEGELMLMIAAIHRGSMEVSTGDKRAIRSLPGLAPLWPAIQALKKRIVCLEQIFSRLGEASGIGRVRAAVTTCPRADETITYVYEHTSAGGIRHFLQGLELVMTEHIRTPAPGWLKDF